METTFISRERWRLRTVWKQMASPIEPTPVLYGADAEALLRELECVCTPEEAKRRIDAARSELRAMLGEPNATTRNDT